MLKFLKRKEKLNIEKANDCRVFATFQPRYVLETIEQSGAYYPPTNVEYKAVSEQLGSNPIFLFELTNEEVYFETLFSVIPSYPEVILIIKTDDYSYIDQSQWFAIRGGKCKEKLLVSKNKNACEYTEVIKKSIKREEVIGLIDISKITRECPRDDARFIIDGNYSTSSDMIPRLCSFIKEFWNQIYFYLPNPKYTPDEMYAFTHSKLFRELFLEIESLYHDYRVKGMNMTTEGQRDMHKKIIDKIDVKLKEFLN